MTRKKSRDPKEDTLREHGVLNLRAEQVHDPLFETEEFFDPRDLLQVKYEMLRRVSVDRQSVSETASAFGFSRPSFYQARESFQSDGFRGLLPGKRGPRRRHKLSGEVMAFVNEERSNQKGLSAAELARRIEERFGLKVHRRSVERALSEQKKKRR